MGSWVKVSTEGMAGLDLERLQALGNEVEIGGQVASCAVDTEGDGKKMQVLDLRPNLDGFSNSTFGLFTLDLQQGAIPLATYPIHFQQINPCAAELQSCVPIVAPTEQVFVGHFLPGVAGDQIAVVMENGAVQLFLWDRENTGVPKECSVHLDNQGAVSGWDCPN